MKILVTGGAGYIGSFMTRKLLSDGFDVLVVDSLERGYDAFIDSRAEFERGDLRDKNFVVKLFAKHVIDCVIHFAGFISVEESMQSPGLYFENNIITAVNLLEEMSKKNRNNFIFSSTAAVYGNPLKTPINEDHQKNPTSPYGYSKLAVEEILKWYNETRKINFVALRYFNASGASLDGLLGEKHNPETHIIPKAMAAATNNKEFILYGNDYPTPDGTCVRDYIHVLDLVDAHLLAMNKVLKDPGGYFYNVGTGRGYSNNEVINVIKEITKINFNIRIAERRYGDSAILIADPTRIEENLGFKPKLSDLKTIVATAWDWHNKNSKA